MMKAEVKEGRIELSDIESPEAVEAYLRAMGFEVSTFFSVRDVCQNIIIYPPKKVAAEWIAGDRIEKAIELGFKYGSTDGAHHKMWVIDQMIRILTDCPTVTRKATDVNQKEYEYQALAESDKYRELLAAFRAGEDGPETYSWDEGIAP